MQECNKKYIASNTILAVIYISCINHGMKWRRTQNANVVINSTRVVVCDEVQCSGVYPLPCMYVYVCMCMNICNEWETQTAEAAAARYYVVIDNA